MDAWSLHPDYSLVVRETNAILFRRRHYHQINLNADASYVVQALTAGQSLTAVCAQLARRLGQPEAQVHGKCEQIVTELQGKGILRHEAGASRIRQQKTRPGLDRLFLELTRICNLRCSHCYSSAAPTSGLRGTEMSLDELYRLIDEAYDAGVWTVDLTGGEVLTHPHFEAVLRRLYARDMATTVFSNLTLLTPAHVELLLETQVKSVATSIDGLSSLTHDTFRGQEGALAKTRRSLRRLLDAGVRCLINTTLTPQNRHEILDLVNDLNQEFGVAVQIAPVVPAGRALDNPELNMSVEEAVVLMHAATKASNRVVAYGISHPATNRKQVNTPCGVGRNFLYVTADGGFHLCPSLTGRENPRFYMGSFSDTPLLEVWNRAMSAAGIRSVQCHEIAQCAHAPVCQGGCRSRAYLTRGQLEAPDEIACAFFATGQASTI